MRLLTNVAKMTKKPAKNIRFCKIVEISQKIQTWTGIATNHEPVIMQLLTNFLKMAKAKNTRFCKEGQELPKMAKKNINLNRNCNKSWSYYYAVADECFENGKSQKIPDFARKAKNCQKLPKNYKPEQDLHQIMNQLLFGCWQMFWKWQKGSKYQILQRRLILPKIAKKYKPEQESQ